MPEAAPAWRQELGRHGRGTEAARRAAVRCWRCGCSGAAWLRCAENGTHGENLASAMQAAKQVDLGAHGRHLQAKCTCPKTHHGSSHEEAMYASIPETRSAAACFADL